MAIDWTKIERAKPIDPAGGESDRFARELEEQERAEESCPHDHDLEKIDEDGCVHCGFYAK